MAKRREKDPLLERMPELEGYKFLDPCVIYSRLGAGAMGAVYFGRHMTLDIDVAVKCLKPALANDPQAVTRFHREAQIAAKIRHQNLVGVFTIDQREGVHYIVMEFVRGETALDRLVRKGPLSVTEACTIIYGACSGLAAAHKQGVVHRDIKPENILISGAGEVKVADLGLAKALGGDIEVTQVGAVMGTPVYMPPEQWNDSGSVGPAGDVYSLAATLYHLLTGQLPIQAKSFQAIMKAACEQPFPDARQHRPELPEELIALLERATSKRPEDRFADAGALMRALEPYCARSEGELADETIHNIAERKVRVSRPPPKVEARIQVEYERASAVRSGSVMQATLELDEEGGSSVTVSTQADMDPPENVPSPTAPTLRVEPEDAQPSRRSWLGLALGGVTLLLLAVGALGWALRPTHAAGPSPEPRPEPDPRERGLALVEQARVERESGEDIERYARALDLLERAREQGAPSELVRERSVGLVGDWSDELIELHEWGAAHALLEAHLGAGSPLLERKLELLEQSVRSALESLVREVRPAANSWSGGEQPQLQLALAAPPDGPTLDQLLVEVRCNGRSLREVEGDFTHAIELLDRGDGELRSTLVLEGVGGVRREFEHVYWLDRQAPELALRTPARPERPQKAPLRLECACEDAGPLQLSVAGASFGERELRLREGVWAVELDLEHGEHELRVRASDAAGNLRELEWSVLVDRVAPRIELDAEVLALEFTSSERVYLRGRVSEPVERLLVDGREIELDDELRFDAQCSLRSEGLQRVELLATDLAGNASDPVHWSTRLDLTRPRLELEAPLSGERSRSGRFEFVGSVSEPSSLWIGEECVEERVAGSFRFELELAEGEHELELWALDRAGNRGLTVTRNLLVSPPYPEVVEGLSFREVNAQGYAEYTLDVDPSVVLIYVPGGTFRMGTDREGASHSRARPSHQVTLSPYFISKFELSRLQYMRYLRSVGEELRRSPVADATVAMDGLAFRDAQEYCRWAGLQLPTEAQWEFAARGEQGRRFPWGEEEPRAGADVQRCAMALYRAGLDHPHPIASYAEFAGPFGTLNQAGNVWEWCADGYGSYDRRPSTDPLAPERAPYVVRGGGYNCRFAHQVESVHRMESHFLRGDADEEAGYFPVGVRPVRSYDG